jgi:predicted kinase
MPTLFLIVGLPGAGKTTRAREIASEHSAVRFSPDEWMAPLFGVSDVERARDTVEGRLIWTAREVLRIGRSAVLDFGLWGRDERAALYWLAASVGARATTVYLPVDRGTQFERVTARWRDTPQDTWPMTQATLDEWRSIFQEPDIDEIAGTAFETSQDWGEWISGRWPSSLKP